MTQQATMAACNTFRAASAGDLLPITGLAGGMDSIRELLSPEQLAAFKPWRSN